MTTPTRSTLKLPKGVTPRTSKQPAHRKVYAVEKKPVIEATAETWHDYKREHHAEKRTSKKTTLFLRRRTRERNRAKFNRHQQPVNEQVAVHEHERKEKRSNKNRFFAKNTLIGQLSEESVKSFMQLKETLAKA